MNVKSIFGTIGVTLSGLFGVLGGLVTVGIMTQIIFGTGILVLMLLEIFRNFVNTFLQVVY